MYKITYHEKVVSVDIPKLSKSEAARVQKTIIEKLTNDPLHFGKYLSSSLHPFRSIRVGDYRIIFSIEPKKEVYIVLIEHRSVSYKLIYKRI